MTAKQFYDWQTSGGTDDVMRLVDVLERADIAWCAIGGVAVNHWAREPMVTQDVGFVVATAAIEQALLVRVRAHRRIRLVEDQLALDLILESRLRGARSTGRAAGRSERCWGAYVMDCGEGGTGSGRIRPVTADGILSKVSRSPAKTRGDKTGWLFNSSSPARNVNNAPARLPLSTLDT